MEQSDKSNKLAVSGLELVLRRSDSKDIGFVYELMRHHLERFFSQISEGWSRKRFKIGYKPERITIIEHEDMPIGFYDLEILNGLAYVHNLHISRDYQGRNIGPVLISYIETESRNSGASYIKAKIFQENEKFLRFLKRKGYRVE